MYTESTDLHEAAFSGDICQLIALLDQNQESVNKKDEIGQTPLHKASMNGWLECVSLLLERGAIVNSQDVAGCTALHLTAANGYREIARHLMEKGHANINHKTNKGHTARHMARSRGHIHMVAFFNDMENKVGSTIRN